MKLRPFELVLVVVFGTLFVLALLLLRGYEAPENETETQLGSVAIWGTLPQTAFDGLLTKIKQTDKGFINVSYRYIPQENFDEVFVNALADQKAPDLLLLPHDRLVKHRTRLQPLSYESVPIRDFRTSYIDGAEIFALSDGVYAFPMAVDPLVMYWNRDIFADQGVLVPPNTWETLVGETVPTFTERDFNRNIEQAGIAMGEYVNIKNAFPILSLLLLQGGSAMVTEEKEQYRVRLNEKTGATGNVEPLTNAAAFFTNFSNTTNTLYSWNRSLRLDRDMFLSEDLALYFGYGSEGVEIAERNPNLSFDIAEVPQGAAATVKRTYGLYYGLAIPKAAPNKNGALAAMQVLGSSQWTSEFSSAYNFAPAHRSLLAEGSNDVYGRIYYQSALYSRGWLNPDLEQMGEVFEKMLDDINANRRDIGAATADAVDRTKQSY